MFGRRGRQAAKTLPGGHDETIFGNRSLLFSSRPLPVIVHAETAVGLGIAVFDQQLLLSGGPSGSPLLNFKATAARIWTINPDGTLYEEVPWSDIRSWDLDKDGDVVVLHGSFIGHEFMRLRLEPMSDYRKPLVEFLGTLMLGRDGEGTNA